MRFFLLVYQYCPHEVAELTDTFLAKDGIGFAAELGSMTFHHLLVPRMIRIFRDTRCLLANGFPALVLGLFGRSSRVRLVIPLLLSVHLFRTITENRSVRILPCLTTPTLVSNRAIILYKFLHCTFCTFCTFDHQSANSANSAKRFFNVF